MALALCIWETEIGSDRTGMKNGHDKVHVPDPSSLMSVLRFS